MEKGKNISRQKVEKRSTLLLDDEVATELFSSKAHRTKCTAKYRKPCAPRSSLKKEVLHPRAVNFKWMGSLNIVGTRLNDIYGEFNARIAREKLLCELDDQKVKFKVRPHRISWPDKFKVDSPSAVDIVFHVLPSKCDRSVARYKSILNFINVNDVSLRSSMAGAELLILSSKHLSVDSERSNRPPYLWGIACFEGAKSSHPSTGKVRHRNRVSSREYRKKGDSDKNEEADYHATHAQNINASRISLEVLLLPYKKRKLSP